MSFDVSRGSPSRLIGRTLLGIALATAAPAALTSLIPDLGLDTAYAQGRSGDNGNSGGGGGNSGGGNGGGGNSGGGNGGGGNGGGGNGGGSNGGGGNGGGGGNSGNQGNSGFSGSGGPGNSGNAGRPDWAGGGRSTAPGQARAEGQNRYNAASGGTPPGLADRDEDGAFSRRIGEVAVELDEDETAALIERGWGANIDFEERDGYEFRNHGERVSTFVEIARTLRELDPSLDIRISDAAMQANFGTPWENDLLARPTEDPLDPDDADSTDDLEDEEEGGFFDQFLDDIADVKPGNGPSTDWETMTDLDVNGDGYVDRADLEALEELAEDGPDDGTAPSE